jgi:hypothetical protein
MKVNMCTLGLEKKREVAGDDAIYWPNYDFCKDHTLKKEFVLGDKFDEIFLPNITWDDTFASFVSHQTEKSDTFEYMLKVIMSMKGISELMKRKSESMKKHDSK